MGTNKVQNFNVLIIEVAGETTELKFHLPNMAALRKPGCQHVMFSVYTYKHYRIAQSCTYGTLVNTMGQQSFKPANITPRNKPTQAVMDNDTKYSNNIPQLFDISIICHGRYNMAGNLFKPTGVIN